MSPLSDLYNRVQTEREEKLSDITSKVERDRLVGDRQNDPPIPEHNHPAPDWVLNPDDPNRQAMRRREQRINELNERLGRASAKLERDFDRSR